MKISDSPKLKRGIPAGEKRIRLRDWRDLQYALEENDLDRASFEIRCGDALHQKEGVVQEKDTRRTEGACFVAGIEEMKAITDEHSNKCRERHEQCSFCGDHLINAIFCPYDNDEHNEEEAILELRGIIARVDDETFQAVLSSPIFLPEFREQVKQWHLRALLKG